MSIKFRFFSLSSTYKNQSNKTITKSCIMCLFNVIDVFQFNVIKLLWEKILPAIFGRNKSWSIRRKNYRFHNKINSSEIVFFFLILTKQGEKVKFVCISPFTQHFFPWYTNLFFTHHICLLRNSVHLHILMNFFCFINRSITF